MIESYAQRLETETYASAGQRIVLNVDDLDRPVAARYIFEDLTAEVEIELKRIY